FSGLSSVRGPVWFATLPDHIRESITSTISDSRTSFRAEPYSGAALWAIGQAARSSFSADIPDSQRSFRPS
ncbi:MAG TPA: hypothetical protein PLR25_28625, partial [Planctomycetaceae bacterium]|nr:hypothetical protein [Planctomycetaceae bacterium]